MSLRDPLSILVNPPEPIHAGSQKTRRTPWLNPLLLDSWVPALHERPAVRFGIPPDAR